MCAKSTRGFTLLELVVGMVVMAIALTMLATLLFPMAERSANSLHRAKASQLAQAVLNQLSGRQFDQQSPVGGGAVTSPSCCIDGSQSMCRAQANNPNDPGSWMLLDRFDDFSGSGDLFFGNDQYAGYNVAITVRCPNELGGWASSWQAGAKLVEVDITTPANEVLAFSQVRGNF